VIICFYRLCIYPKWYIQGSAHSCTHAYIIASPNERTRKTEELSLIWQISWFRYSYPCCLLLAHNDIHPQQLPRQRAPPGLVCHFSVGRDTLLSNIASVLLRATFCSSMRSRCYVASSYGFCLEISAEFYDSRVSYSFQMGLGGTSRVFENLVRLSPRSHFIAYFDS